MTNYYIGFDLGGSALKYGYGNSTEGLLYFKNKPHKDKSIAGLKSLFAEAIDDLKAHHPTFTALGIASPGIIDKTKGSPAGSTPNIPFIKDINLVEILNEIAHIPVFIDNDANLMTLAEAHHSTLHTPHSTLGITIGSGIGTGYVFHNTILSGEQNKAMEAGHIIVVPDGRQCLCGKKGCFEAYCSAESMKRIIYEKFPEMQGQTINHILDSDNPAIQIELHHILDIFAIAISNLVMTLNPGNVVIGGGVIEIPSFDFEYLKDKIYENLMPEFTDFNIKKAQYGNKAGVIGAFLLAELEHNL